MDVSFLTVDDVAARLAVNRVQVHRLISTGALQAVNISSGKGERASWRIPPEALGQFERSRSNRASQTTRATGRCA